MDNLPFGKTEIFRSKKLTNASRGRPCAFCGCYNDTVIRAHFSAPGAVRLGKGMGIKPHDFAAADACGKCHGKLDGEWLNSPDIYEKWLFAILETWRRDLAEGIIKI